MTTFERCLEFLKPWEGVDSDHPQDRGGRTRFGISQKAHPDVDVPNLTWEKARDIYRVRYWGEAGCERSPPDVAFALFDAAVQHNPRRAIRFLQMGLGITADGIYGPVTERAVRNHPNAALEMMGERGEFYARIVSGRPSQKVFMDGWFRRLVYAVHYLHAL